LPKTPIDCLVAGAGFSGLVMAQQLSELLGWKVLVCESRPHIGGNARDYHDDAGVLVHAYGPHYFRTNSERIVRYLSRFTEWRKADYIVKSHTAGRYWSFPINLNTFEEFLGRPSSEEEFRAYLDKVRVPIANPANSEEVVLARIGREWYEKFFESYTLKQWRRHPRDLDPEVCARIPIRFNRDDRYLSDDFQCLPSAGYTAMFEAMIEASPRLKVLTSTPLSEAARHFSWKHLVYTGPVDSYFRYVHGRLPYRSLRFEHESFDAKALEERVPVSGKTGHWQPVVQVNYPDPSVPHTRVVEIKHATGQSIDATTIVREFPADYEETGEPFYPIPAPETRLLHARYRELAEKQKGVTFVGRLARYQYYNMDQVVGMALKTAADLAAQAR
jgi:UDP-galactopyranose mutase